MEGKGILNLTKLKDQIYEYLRYQMRIGEIKPGSVIDMTVTSKKLGISRTPLRDALIQLEMDGFADIPLRLQAALDIFFCYDLYFLTIVGRENRSENAPSASAA